MYKVIVIGAVESTKQILLELVRHEFDVVGVIGHKPRDFSKVAGWVDLEVYARDLNIDFLGFTNVNEVEILNWARAKSSDIIFAVGFSQLLNADWFEIPKMGCIGFHPTVLPKGRGRAPLAWLVLDNCEGAATFFLMGDGADDGPIFVQEPFSIDEDDDAGVIAQKIGFSIVRALEKWLPSLRSGWWNPLSQNSLDATWYGKRNIEDGLINWENDATYLNKLVKASSKPHPGAYTYFQNTKLIIWKCKIENNIKIKGVTGRVLLINNTSEYLVQCGSGLLWLQELDMPGDVRIRVGDRLGYNVEDEIFRLRRLFDEKINE